jgi:glycerol-3-phosphate dehydrogenase
MTIKNLLKKLNTRYHSSVTVEVADRSIILRGVLDNYADILAFGKAFARQKSNIHVVNDITDANAIPEQPYIPDLQDTTLDNAHFDVVVIGGGVVGGAILRELTRYNLTALLVEKHSDVAMGASGANDGMVHAGIDLKKRCKKLYYGVRGNAMYPALCRELNVPFNRRGQYVVFDSRLIKFLAHTYVLRARRHNIDGVKIISKKAIDAIEPSVASYSVGALYAPTTGNVSPYQLTIALAENAVSNGARVSLNTYVHSFSMDGDHIATVNTNRGSFSATVVINAAGVYADIIAGYANDRYFSLHPRKGTDIILDSNAVLPTHNISRGPSLKTLGANKNTKGGGIVYTVDGNILLGPDAVETPLREDTSTSAANVDAVLAKQQQCCPDIAKSHTIAYFSGVRACTYEEDFIIEPSKKVDNLVHVAGIQSPGLTAAPAIAVDVAAMCVDILAKCGQKPSLNPNFNPKREEILHVNRFDDEQRAQLIKSDPDYGKIICRCCEISLAEVKNALRRPIVAPTVDAVKRRTRSGMGRCQGGFCQPLIIDAIAQYTDTEKSDVTKGDIGSDIFVGEPK